MFILMFPNYLFVLPDLLMSITAPENGHEYEIPRKFCFKDDNQLEDVWGYFFKRTLYIDEEKTGATP